jgi:hypothetical protein
MLVCNLTPDTSPPPSPPTSPPPGEPSPPGPPPATEDTLNKVLHAVGAGSSAMDKSINAQGQSTGNKLDGLGTKLDGIGNQLDGLGDKLDGIGDALGQDGECKTSDCGEGEGGRPGGSGDGSGECPYGPEDIRCTGADPWKDMLPDNLDGPPTLEDAYSDFKSELGNGPLGPVINYQANDDPGGDCPTFTIPESKYWTAQTVDSHCQVYNHAAPIIYAVMTWAWAFIALFLILF